MVALPAVAAQAAQYIDLDPKVTVASIQHKTEENGKKQKYNAIQASISAPLAQIGQAGQGTASLAFVEYSDKKNNSHRIITQQNLAVSSNVHTAFFNTLAHALKIHAQKVANPALNNQALNLAVPEAVQISDKDLKIGEPKKNKSGVIELVASSALINGCKIQVAQDKKGACDVVVSKDDKVKFEKAKKDAKSAQADAVMNTLQQKCLAKIAQFIKANEGKKIEKPVHKKDGKAAKKADKADHKHKAKHAEHKKDKHKKHADDKKHHHGHKKH